MINRDKIDIAYLKQLNAALSSSLQEAKKLIMRHIEQMGWDKIDNAPYSSAIIEAQFAEVVARISIPQLSALVGEQYKDMLKKSSRVLKDAQLNWDIKDSNTIKMLSDNNSLFVSKFYDHSQAGKVRKNVLKIFEQGKSRDQVASEMVTELSRVSKAGKVYNEIMVKAASSRARSFAQVRKFEKIGRTHFEWFGYKDERTCPICSSGIGSKFEVAQQLEIMEKYLAIDYGANTSYETAIAEVKRVAPWFGYDEKEDKLYTGSGEDKKYYTQEQFRSKVSLPCHGLCRCEWV